MEEQSEWSVVDGEMHEIGDHVPQRERFVIPRENIPNKQRKQLREQFMRRTHLVLKESTPRHLAQNREATRKSRLRKKTYVQQLESSILKLTHLEQDLQRARSQVGHSIGSYISIKMFKKSPEKVKYCIGLCR